jgi:hypothetical protein
MVRRNTGRPRCGDLLYMKRAGSPPPLGLAPRGKQGHSDGTLNAVSKGWSNSSVSPSERSREWQGRDPGPDSSFGEGV